jgi:hypothetical protein
MPWPAVIVHPNQPAFILQTEGGFESPVPRGRDWRRRVIGQLADLRDVGGGGPAQEVERRRRSCRRSVRGRGGAGVRLGEGCVKGPERVDGGCGPMVVDV